MLLAHATYPKLCESEQHNEEVDELAQEYPRVNVDFFAGCNSFGSDELNQICNDVAVLLKGQQYGRKKEVERFFNLMLNTNNLRSRKFSQIVC